MIALSLDSFWHQVIGVFRLGLSRSDSVRPRSDPIHYPFVQTNTAKIYNAECHLNDTMNKEHKIHQTASNIMLLFVMFDEKQFVDFFWQQCHVRR